MQRTGYTARDQRNADAARDESLRHYALTGEITDEFTSHVPASAWIRQALARWIKGDRNDSQGDDSRLGKEQR